MSDDAFWTQPRDKSALVHLEAIHVAAFAAVAALAAAVALELDRRQRRREREERKEREDRDRAGDRAGGQEDEDEGDRA